MLLAIDIGNTRIKAAVFEGETLLKQIAFGADDGDAAISRLLQEYPKVEKAVLSSVANDAGFLPDSIEVVRVGRDWRFPFENLYATPETLGIDRMVLAAGAALMHPGRPALVIDAGTCITYDFLDLGGRYLGGAISPGLRTRYRALHDYTAKLPLLQPSEPESIVGNTTEASIHSGVVTGILAEIDAFRSSQNEGNFIIILTGGDSEFLASQVKNRIFANPNFLLESLNRLFQYQITK